MAPSAPTTAWASPAPWRSAGRSLRRHRLADSEVGNPATPGGVPRGHCTAAPDLRPRLDFLQASGLGGELLVHRSDEDRQPLPLAERGRRKVGGQRQAGVDRPCRRPRRSPEARIATGTATTTKASTWSPASTTARARRSSSGLSFEGTGGAGGPAQPRAESRRRRHGAAWSAQDLRLHPFGGSSRCAAGPRLSHRPGTDRSTLAFNLLCAPRTRRAAARPSQQPLPLL